MDKTFPPDPRVENEALALLKDGHQVFLFCLTYHKDNSEENIKGIELRRYLSNKLEYKLSALAYTVSFYGKLMSSKIVDFIAKNGIEIIHIHDMVIAEAVFRANRSFKLPVILDLHENRPEIMKTYPHLSKFPGNILISPGSWKKKESEFVARADHVVVVTQEAKEELITRVGVSKEHISVVPNTVEESFYKDFNINQSVIDRYNDKFVILYLGDTGLRRGLLSVIEALPLLVDENDLGNKIKLVIVGKNSTDGVLKKRVDELGLNKVVDFEGWQDMSLFPSYLTIADLGISPLHRNPHHDTTYANKLFQYMGFSLPVLVSDAVAQKNLIEQVHCGMVHKDRDIKDIAAKVMTLYSDPELAKKLGSNGKEFIEDKFSWEKVSGNLKNLYLEFEKL